MVQLKQSICFQSSTQKTKTAVVENLKQSITNEYGKIQKQRQSVSNVTKNTVSQIVPLIKISKKRKFQVNF